MKTTLSTRSSQLDRLPGILSPQSTFDGVSAGLPCALPFRRVLVRLVDEPIDGLLRRSNDDADATVSQYKRGLPSMHHHGCSPSVRRAKEGNTPQPRIVPDQERKTPLGGTMA